MSSLWNLSSRDYFLDYFFSHSGNLAKKQEFSQNNAGFG